jgi:Restriction endonuclease
MNDMSDDDASNPAFRRRRPSGAYVKPSPVRNLVWGYDGDQFDPGRRVSVAPYEMIGDILYAGIEARGMLLTLFCRYWAKDRPVTEEHLRRELRLPRRKAALLVRELIELGLIRKRGVHLSPGGAFGAGPDVSTNTATLPSREMPSDWRDLREAVFARDGYACVYCGSGRDLHCDHVVPMARGGDHRQANLVTACATCNLQKGSKTVEEWRPDIAAHMARLAEAER